MFSESWVGMEFHSYPVFLLMKSAARNTPKVISNTPNRNKFSPKVIFVTPRVFCNNFIMLASYESIVVLRYSKTKHGIPLNRSFSRILC